MKYFITGGAGFIGSHIVDALVKGNKVVVYDNLSSGSKDFISHHFKNKNFKFIKGDLLDKKFLGKSIKGCDFVFHLAANPDIKKSSLSPRIDFEQGILVTFNVLEAMRKNKIKKIAFSSTSAVFGEPEIMPTPENYGPLKPVSVYGASKLSCEALISSYCSIFDWRAWVFRFANVIGPRLTHGAIFDFINKLKRDKKILRVLGNGKQKKSYIHVKDCVRGILHGIKNSSDKFNLFNLGTEDSVMVREIAKTLLNQMGLKKTKIVYSGGDRGWVGDVPKMLLDTRAIKLTGWSPLYNSRQAVVETIKANI
jgi:UDP-glucose 4-epimerase